MSARSCQQCGGTITDDQIARKEAGLVKGVLLCPSCVAAKRQAMLAQRAAPAVPTAAAVPMATAVPVATAAPVGAPAGGSKTDLLDEPLSLVEGEEITTKPSSVIRSFAAGSALGTAQRTDKFSRPLAGHGDGATRCRTFHTRLNDASIVHMDDQINEWLDAHPDIFVKHISTTVGTFEGKHPEPHLVVSVFY